MIERYSRKELAVIWQDQAKFKKWLEVELAVLKVLEESKLIPRGIFKKVYQKAKIDVKRIKEIEQITHHDVIAFTTSIAEQVGIEARFFHYGLTSSDVVDTAFSLLLRDALNLINKDIDELKLVLKKLAKQHQNTLTIGRTHGMHAEPMSFGLKFLAWYADFDRQQKRLKGALNEIATGKLSGAVGCYGILSPAVEIKALKKLNLSPEPIATQVIPRDRHAQIFTGLANLGGCIERVCLELRHLQRSEVNELEENFSVGQKGSSAMPHKKNPISAENLTGCARLLRSYAQASLENIALWHERDISHSSVERVIAPDATILVDYMLSRLTKILNNLKIKPSNIAKNLASSQGVYFSGKVLVRLVEKGLSREVAYQIVQQAASEALQQQRWFGDILAKNAELRKLLSKKELNELLNNKKYLQHTQVIYKRVLG